MPMEIKLIIPLVLELVPTMLLFQITMDVLEMELQMFLIFRDQLDKLMATVMLVVSDHVTDLPMLLLVEELQAILTVGNLNQQTDKEQPQSPIFVQDCIRLMFLIQMDV